MIGLPSFSRHALKLLSMCCVLKSVSIFPHDLSIVWFFYSMEQTGRFVSWNDRQSIMYELTLRQNFETSSDSRQLSLFIKESSLLKKSLLTFGDLI